MVSFRLRNLTTSLCVFHEDFLTRGSFKRALASNEVPLSSFLSFVARLALKEKMPHHRVISVVMILPCLARLCHPFPADPKHWFPPVVGVGTMPQGDFCSSFITSIWHAASRSLFRRHPALDSYFMPSNRK